VLEAKKVGRSFQIPNTLASTRVTSFRKLKASASKDLSEALDQCLRYTQHTGALYACATNGIDWVIFKPSHPFRSLPDAKVFMFHGSDQIAKRIDEFSDLLSPIGVREGRTEKELLGHEIQIPIFAKRLRDAFPYRGEMTFEEEEYSNALDHILMHYVVELTDEVMFRECYIPANGNRPPSSTLDALVADRIKLAKKDSSQETLDFGSDSNMESSVSEMACGRIVVLHGEVGVGKTSFLRHCELSLREDGKLEEAVWARVNLLPFQDRQFDPENVKELLNLICREIQNKVSESTEKMSGRYDPDIWDHLRDIYNFEVRRFQKARYPDSDNSDQEFLNEARKYVWDLREDDPQSHLIRVIRWLTVNCRLPVIIVLDNSDQLGIEFQEFLYKLSETVQTASSAVVILVMRTEALESHVIREHSIASVREQYLVEKAPLPAVLSRRFQNILSRLPKADAATTDKVARDRITVLMETLQYEAKLGSDMFQLVEAAGNGSLRDSLRAVSAIFRSSPRMMDQLVFKHNKAEKPRVTVDETLKAFKKEDLSNADSNMLIPNVFDVSSHMTIPYSLGVRQIQHIRSKTASTECTVASLLNDFAIAGIDRGIAHYTLSKLRASQLISVNHMLLEIRESDKLSVTRLGGILLDIILFESSYFGGAAFNTYIYRKDVYYNMRSAWTSNAPNYYQKFDAIAKQFIKLIADDDSDLQVRIDSSILEPIVSKPLPGLLGKVPIDSK